MKLFLLAIALLVVLMACSAPIGSPNENSTTPTLKNWRVYLSSPSIDGMTPYIYSAAYAWLPTANPLADKPIVLIGTPPPLVIPKANFPYLMYGNNATSAAFHVVEPGTGIAISTVGTGQSDVQNHYRLYPLDWTTVSTALISHSGEVFSVTAHGLQEGDTVYLAGTATSTKASGAYLVLSVPTVNSFTLSGAAPGNGDIFHYLAKVNSSPGNSSF